MNTNKATASSLIMISTVLLLGGSGYLSSVLMSKKISVIEEISKELDSVSVLNLTLHEAVSYLNNYVATGDPDEIARYRKASSEVQQLFDTIIAQERKMGKLDVSLENARELYSNIDRMSEDLFKYEVPLDNNNAVVTMLEIQQNVDWISRLYIQVHKLKDMDKLETTLRDAESATRWAGRMQIAGTICALVVVLFYKRAPNVT